MQAATDLFKVAIALLCTLSLGGSPGVHVSTTSDQTAAMHPQGAQYTVSGYVVTVAGEPVPNARLTLHPPLGNDVRFLLDEPSIREALTGPDGLFRLETGGELAELVVRAEGFAPNAITLAPASHHPGTRITLMRPSDIVIRCRACPDHAVIQLTDSSYLFRQAPIRSGESRFQQIQPGWVRARVVTDNQASLSPTVQMTSDALKESIIRLEPYTGAVEGLVIANDGSSLRLSIELALHPDAQEVRSTGVDQGGSFSFRFVKPGHYDVIVQRSGGRLDCGDLLVSDQTVHHQVVLGECLPRSTE